MRHALLSLLTSLLLVTAAPAQQPVTARPSLAIRNVSVIDVRTGAIQRNVTVTISRGRIAAMESGDRIDVAADVRVVDGSGKFLIPGLWDMHVHWYDERFLPLFTVNGVTGVRQMWGMPVHFDWRKRVKADRLVAPRQYIGSTIVDGPNPVWPGSLVVANAAEARTAVQTLDRLGFDFIKVYARLPKDAYIAIAQETKARGLSFAGHVPRAVTALEAAEAGQRSIEHMSGVLEGTSSAEDQIRSRRAELLKGGEAREGIDVATRDALLQLDERLLATFDEAKASALFASFARNGTWHCPTLTVLRSMASLDDSTFTSDPRLKYMPSGIRTSWAPSNDPRLASKRPVDYAVGRRLFRKNLELVGRMRRAGVRLIAGTDVLNPFTFPGFSLHDELGLLVEAGLTPLEAIQSATINAAEYASQSREVGTIDVGKVADLVLLDASPLDDIGNTKRIAAVVIGGRLLQRTELDGVLNEVERIANLKSIAEPMFRTIETQGVSAAIAQYRAMKTNAGDVYDFDESELNELGYRLLQTKKVSDALQVFRLNVEAYPDSSNAYDSLAEAYTISGDKERAIQNYRTSLKLDPQNVNAAAMLKKLGGH